MARYHVTAWGATDGSPDLDEIMTSEEIEARRLAWHYPMVSTSRLEPISLADILNDAAHKA
jgi:hypothetical protein